MKPSRGLIVEAVAADGGVRAVAAAAEAAMAAAVDAAAVVVVAATVGVSIANHAGNTQVMSDE